MSPNRKSRYGLEASLRCRGKACLAPTEGLGASAPTGKPELVFLKLGGSLLTDKGQRGSFRSSVVRRLGAEIRRALEQRPNLRLLLGHGAGAFGHFPAKKFRTREGLPGGGGWEGFAATRRAVVALNHLLLESFAKSGFHPSLVSPVAGVITDRGRVRRWDLSVLRTLLDSGQVPMIHGDCVLDRARGFTILSTEELFRHLAGKLKPQRILLACDVPGVHLGDPRARPRPPILTEVDASNRRAVLKALGASAACDVTGGMAAKLEHLSRMARRYPGMEVRILSGLLPGRVESALLGGPEGTLIAG